MNHPDKRPRVAELARSRKYAWLFASLVCVAFISPLLPPGSIANIGVGALITLAAMAGIYVVVRLHRLRAVMVLLLGVLVVSNWVGSDVLFWKVLAFIARVSFFGILGGLVFADVLYGRHNRVSERLFGAAAIYLLMAFVLRDVYLLIDFLAPGSFTQPLDVSTATYFSFVTQTTLGYGDIAPVNDRARVVATMQATMGVLYIAITIARLVSMDVETDGDEDEPTKE